MNIMYQRLDSIKQNRYRICLCCVLPMLLIYGNIHAQNSTFNNALLLNGNEDYVQVGSDNSLIVTDSVTIEAWISSAGPGSSSSGAGGIIVNKEGEYEVARFSDGTIQWALANTGSHWSFINTGHVVPENQWTHIAIVYNMANVRTYVNGELIHALAGSGSIGDVDPSQGDFRIGGRQHESQYFDGLIDEVRIWNVARTQSQIQASMNDTLSMEYYSTPDSGLIGYWRFDALEDFDINGDGVDDVRDFSINANHGDLVGDVSLLPSGVPIGIEAYEIGIPERYTLGQNYPNPFNPATTITFDLPQPGRVTLKVYDVLGREVAVLAWGDYPAGRFRTEWNATGLPSGVYIYRLEAGNFTETEKLILQK